MAKRRPEREQFRARTQPYGTRRVGERAEQKRILVVCGGETEEWYFDKFRAIVRPLKMQIRTNGVDPKRLVEWAAKIKAKEEINGDLDAVWCVFDCDDFGARYDQAHADAQGAGFEVAASNPCFELWFVLHYREIHHALSTADCQNLLGALLKKTYSKTDAALFSELEPRRSKAMERAAKLQEQPRQSGASAAAHNPSTTVHQLLESLQGNGLR